MSLSLPPSISSVRHSQHDHRSHKIIIPHHSVPRTVTTTSQNHHVPPVASPMSVSMSVPLSAVGSVGSIDTAKSTSPPCVSINSAVQSGRMSLQSGLRGSHETCQAPQTTLPVYPFRTVDNPTQRPAAVGSVGTVSTSSVQLPINAHIQSGRLPLHVGLNRSQPSCNASYSIETQDKNQYPRFQRFIQRIFAVPYSDKPKGV